MGDATIGLAYVWDGSSAGDVDGATITASSVSISMPVGAMSVTAAAAQSENGSTKMNDSGVSISYAVAGGTLGVGYNVVSGDTAADEAESLGLTYSTSMGGATVKLGYQNHDGSSNTAQTTDIVVSQPLGGGASIWAEMRSTSGTRAAETASTSDTVFAVGTSVSF